MENNEKTVPGSEGSLEDNPKIKGDTIGDTAYSERFVIKSLLQLMNISKLSSLETFIEKQLCCLWDMTAEKDVVNFLLENNAIEIICHSMETVDNTRLTEVCIGIVGNMCCFSEAIDKLKSSDSLTTSILKYLTSEDSLIIVQVLRFIFSNIYNDVKNFISWLGHLIEINFICTINFILSNSTNTEVLLNTFETLNCICSVQNKNSDKDKFEEVFISAEFINSTIVGFEELLKSLELSPPQNSENIERSDVVFLAMHSILTTFPSSKDAYIDDIPSKFLTCINNILIKNIDNESDALVDAVEYTTAIISSLSCFKRIEANSIFLSVTKIWTKISQNHSDSSRISDSGDQNIANNNDLLTILPEYFVRTIPIFSKEELSRLLANFEIGHLSQLSTTIEKHIQTKKMDHGFDNVCQIINKFVIKTKEESE